MLVVSERHAGRSVAPARFLFLVNFREIVCDTVIESLD